MARLVCLWMCAAALIPGGRAANGRHNAAGSKLRPTGKPPEHNHALLPGQCRVSGMALFDSAMWSPHPCSVCKCQAGTVRCHPIPCIGSSKRQDVKNDKDITEERNSLQRRSSGQSKISGALDIKTKMEERMSKPQAPVLAGKQVPAKKTIPQVVHHKRNEKPLLRTSARTGSRFQDSFATSDEDDLDDDLDSDDVMEPPPATVSRVALPPVIHTVPVAHRSPVPANGPAFPRKPVFTESMPPGCLLSDSLIACGSTGMTHMPVITDPGVKTLYLADNRINKIPARALAGLPNLEWLDLSKNKLQDSSLSPVLFQNLSRLRRLILDGNNLTKIPAFLPPSLVELKMNENKLSGLTPSSFKGLSKLLTLELEDNHFHDGNVSPLTFRPLKKLIYLRLEDNKFRAIPSGLPSSLQELHLSDNKIEVVHSGILNKTLNLQVLDLSHNCIREDRIDPQAWIHLLKLESLDLSQNKLMHVPSFLPRALRHLVLHHNQIELIPGYVFGHMRPGLESLHLSHNRLRDNGIDAVSFLGLSASLSELLLDHNQLQSVPRGLLQLKNLQHLRLNNNLISYVPMNALCDTSARDDSPLLSVHLENNLIQPRHIPPTAFTCIRNYYSVQLRPQRHRDYDY